MSLPWVMNSLAGLEGRTEQIPRYKVGKNGRLDPRLHANPQAQGCRSRSESGQAPSILLDVSCHLSHEVEGKDARLYYAYNDGPFFNAWSRLSKATQLPNTAEEGQETQLMSSAIIQSFGAAETPKEIGFQLLL